MDRWNAANSYESFMGRWSRRVAGRFLQRLAPEPNLTWLDVGCGTGALLGAIVETARPSLATGVDLSEGFVEAARSILGDDAEIHQASGDHLPFEDNFYDMVVSGLALNFMPDSLKAVGEWHRVARPGGTVSAYVWDYAEGMQFLRFFWDAVVDLDPDSNELDERSRFPDCHPDRLEALFLGAGLSDVETGRIDIETVFSDFEDYWAPFTLGQGPAPGYVESIGEAQRDRLAALLEERLPHGRDREIPLTARAWVVQGRS